MVICLKTLFHPYQPTFGSDEVFFFLNHACSSPKPENIKIQFLFKVIELQTLLCLPKFLGATSSGTPQNRSPKIGGTTPQTPET